MSYFLVGILKIVILEASAALTIIDRLLGTGDGSKRDKERRWAWVAIAALALFGFGNFGELRGGGGMVHTWEQFHFYMGAKYLKEVGWFDLYKAALLADRETVNRVGGLKTIREIHTFEQVPAETVFAESDRIKGRFRAERWEQFKRDWVVWTQLPVDWNGVLNDHGNSNSPAWAILATPLANLLPVTHGAQVFIGMLDVALLAALIFMLYRTFDVRVASAAVVIWSAAPLVFDYLAGSFLRWDWVFAVGMAACFIKRGRFALAGGFLGYAIATKLFPLFFGVGFLVQPALEAVRTRKLDRRYLRFGVSLLATFGVLVISSSAMLGGLWSWREYKERIAVAQEEKYYGIQYSLRTIYLQVEESSLAELGRGWFYPFEIKQARADVDIKDHRVGFFVVQLLFSALILAMAARTDALGGFLLGPLFVFTWLMVNMYYWGMLAFVALGFARREQPRWTWGLLWLHFNFALFYFYQHTRHGYAEGYIVALFIALGILAVGGTEAWALYKAKWSPFPAATPTVPARGR